MEQNSIGVRSFMFLNTKAEASITEPHVLSLAIKSSTFCWVSHFPKRKVSERMIASEHLPWFWLSRTLRLLQMQIVKFTAEGRNCSEGENEPSIWKVSSQKKALLIGLFFFFSKWSDFLKHPLCAFHCVSWHCHTPKKFLRRLPRSFAVPSPGSRFAQPKGGF